MKPNWSTAPEWARYLAKDQNGYWYWYTDKPTVKYRNGHWQHKGKLRLASVDHGWKNTLEARPKL